MKNYIFTMVLILVLLAPACIIKTGINPSSDSGGGGGGETGEITIASSKDATKRATFAFTITNDVSDTMTPTCLYCYSSAAISDAEMSALRDAYIAGTINCETGSNCTSGTRYNTISYGGRNYSCLKAYDATTCSDPWCADSAATEVSADFPGMLIGQTYYVGMGCCVDTTCANNFIESAITSTHTVTGTATYYSLPMSSGDFDGDGADEAVFVFADGLNLRYYYYANPTENIDTPEPIFRSGMFGVFGVSSTVFADTNGDGYDELFIGDPSTGFAFGNDIVYTINGRSGGFTDSSIDLSTWCTTSNNCNSIENSVGTFGNALSVGNFSSSVSVLLVGAPEANCDGHVGDEGCVYLYAKLTAASWFAELGDINEPENNIDQWGTWIVTKVDANDMATVAITAKRTDDDTFTVYSLRLDSAASATTHCKLNYADYAAAASELIPTPGVADINGDGVMDIIVSALGKSTAGAVIPNTPLPIYIYDGNDLTYSDGGAVPAACVTSPTSDYTLMFASPTDDGGGYLGYGDYNGDGQADLLIGSSIYLGGKDWSEYVDGEPDIDLSGYDTNLFGLLVTSGDYNGDSYDDIMMVNAPSVWPTPTGGRLEIVY